MELPPLPAHLALDEDALIAALDLIGRTGAEKTEIGWDDAVDPWTWNASAMYRGARVIVDDYPDPVGAVEALARRLLEGGTCKGCNRTITLSGEDGERCRWTRSGAAWVRPCRPPGEDAPTTTTVYSGTPAERPPNRAERRRAEREARRR